jgi:hypothetical protein
MRRSHCRAFGGGGGMTMYTAVASIEAACSFHRSSREGLHLHVVISSGLYVFHVQPILDHDGGCRKTELTHAIHLLLHLQYNVLCFSK